MAIRWFGVEMSISRAFPNLIVMVALVAGSGGLAAAGAGQKKDRRWQLLAALSVPLLIAILDFAVPIKLPFLTIRLDAGSRILEAIIALMVVVVGLYFIFRELGVLLGEALEEMPPLRAYSINLLGSIAGIVAFGLISFFNMPPWLWILILGSACCAVFRSKLVPVAVVLLAGLTFAMTNNSYWSAYSKLDVVQLQPESKSIVGDKSYLLHSNNHYFHFGLHILPSEEIARLPEPARGSEAALVVDYLRWLHIAMHCTPAHDRVLVLGAGSGNDVATALADGAKVVHAVEIDPVITSLGYTLHPDKPNTDPRTVAHNEDARTFLRYSPEKFDLIEFAYLDPGATVETASFIRVDNYVYTAEAMKAALRHLTPNGTVCLTFATGPDNTITWRIYEAIRAATGGTPPITYFDKDHENVMFLFGPGAQQTHIPEDVYRVRAMKPNENRPIQAATDDWPFLYLQYDASAMYMYFGFLFLAVVLPTLLIAFTKSSTISGAEWGAMFFLGQAFMLIETKSITKLSLLFGATWVVSSIVILAILCLAYLATIFVSRAPKLNLHILYALLLLTLLLEYFIPIPDQTTLHPVLLGSGAATIATLPIFFGSTIFSCLFKTTPHPAAFLSANLLGVAIGGLTENLAVATGLHNLSLVAILIYACSYICTLRLGTPETSPAPAATES